MTPHRSVRTFAVAWVLALASMPASSPAGDDNAAMLPSDPRFAAFGADGSRFVGRLDAIDDDLGLTLTDDEGEAETMAVALLEKFERVDPTDDPGPSDPSLIILPDGDRVRGIIDRADDRALSIRSSRLGAFELPLEAVIGFTMGTDPGPGPDRELGAILARESFESDLILLENGDRRPATFAGLDGSHLTYRADDREAKLPRSTVRSVALDPSLASYPAPEGPSMDVLLVDGSRIRLLDPEINDGRLEGTTRFEGSLGVDLDDVRTVYIVGGPVAYLSDMAPAREISVPYLGPTRSARSGATVLGEPLTVGGRSYPRGIGTQSRSLLAYPIGPEARLFRAQVALDDASYPLGNVVFRVLVDAEERYVSPPISSGTAPVPVEVDVSGGSFLILVTEFGRGGGIRDYADWLEARFVR